MTRTYKRKLGSRTYRSYTSQQLEEAVKKIKTGALTLRKASEKYKISRGTLSNRVRGLHKNKPGHPNVFSEHEERSLVSHITAVSEWGFPFTTMDMRFVAKSYIDAAGRKVSCFKNNFPTSEWARSFIKRHEVDLTQRACQNIKKVRASISPEVINDFFDNLEKSLTNEDGTKIDAHCIFNYDETNLTDDPGVIKCIFKRGVKYPERIRDGTKSSTSLMFCGSADGTILPPYVVYKAENLWDRWTEGGLRGVRYNRSKSGWFDTVTFTDWFSTTFLPFVRRLGKRVVLIGDNLASHFSESVIKSAQENDVHFVCLPKNATHLCQPLDVAFYRPLKRCWRSILDDWKQRRNTKSSTVTKEAFPGLLRELCLAVCGNDESHLRSDNLVSGFRKCGIVPLDRSQVLNRLPSDILSPTEVDGCKDVNTTMSESVISHLKQMRYGSDSATVRKKRSRIDVIPGRSVCWEDLQQGRSGLESHQDAVAGTSTGTSHCGTTTTSMSSTATGKGKRRRVIEPPSSSEESDIELTDHSTCSTGGSGENCSDSDIDGSEQNPDTGTSDTGATNLDTVNGIGTETAADSSGTRTSCDAVGTKAARSPATGKYIVAQFDIGKTVKHYIGKVLETEDDDMEVSFLRQSKLPNNFRFPEAEDVCAIDKSQVVVVLSDPSPGRRGLLSFGGLDKIVSLHKLRLM